MKAREIFHSFQDCNAKSGQMTGVDKLLDDYVKTSNKKNMINRFNTISDGA